MLAAANGSFTITFATLRVPGCLGFTVDASGNLGSHARLLVRKLGIACSMP